MHWPLYNCLCRILNVSEVGVAGAAVTFLEAFVVVVADRVVKGIQYIFTATPMSRFNLAATVFPTVFASVAFDHIPAQFSPRCAPIHFLSRLTRQALL